MRYLIETRSHLIEKKPKYTLARTEHLALMEDNLMNNKTNWKEIENADNVRVIFKDGVVWEGDAGNLDITDEGDTLSFWFKGKPYCLMLNEIDYCELIKYILRSL